MFAEMTSYLKKASFIWLSIALFVSPLPLSKRSKRSLPDSPCLAIQEPPNVPQNITENLSDLTQRATDLESETTDAIAYLAAKMSHYTIQALNLESFLETPNGVGDEDLNATSALTAYQYLLFDMFYHINRCVTSGQISELSGDDNIKTKMESIRKEIYDIICAVNLALIKQKMPIVDVEEEPAYSSLFESLDISATHEEYRAYIILRDNESLMAYLKGSFKEME